MADTYLSFLKTQNAAALASNASLHYITTTTSISEPAAIIKHFQAQDKLLKKKAEKVLSIFTSTEGIVLETETTIEFTRSGGAYLPQMDDNMLSDSVVTVPIVHIVQLDASGSIGQIRLYWDQSTMLKQIDAIGRTGRNWPIRDGAAQCKVVQRSVAGAANSNSNGNGNVAAVGGGEFETASRPSLSNKDFHTRLFDTGNGLEEGHNHNRAASVATRVSAKPAAREWNEIFANGEGPQKLALSPSPNKDKDNGTILKAGAGKNFGQSRLFDQQKHEEEVATPDARRKAHPTKFNHFEFGNGEDAAPMDGNRPPSATAQKHMNKWDFEDFVTPPKIATKKMPELERHFGAGIDEVTRVPFHRAPVEVDSLYAYMTQEEPPTPAKRPVVHAPRPDADAHFTLTDKMSPAVDRKTNNARFAQTSTDKTVLGTITNTNVSRRDNEYASHYTSTDASPAPQHQDENSHSRKPSHGVRSEKEQAHFHMHDEPTPEKIGKIYKTAGNGMGGRKNEAPAWALGDDAPPAEVKKIYKTYGNGMGGRRDAAPEWSWGDRDDQIVSSDAASKKIYRTAGDGMGGKKRETDRSSGWGMDA